MYFKEFTRDYTILFEEIWPYSITERLGPLFNIKVPKENFIIFHFVDGIIETWTNKEALNALLISLDEDVRSRPDEFNKILDDYLERLDGFRSFFAEKHTDSREVLDKFIDMVYDILPYFIVMYYIAEKGLGTEEIKVRAQKMREEDLFYDHADNYIRHSIAKVFPEIEGFETTLRKEEFNNTPSRDELERRLKEFVFIPNKVQDNIDLKTFAHNQKEYQFDFPVVEDSAKEIRGTVAFPGKAQGKVRIVRRNIEISTVQEGEILVSPMTTPEYVPSMKKAKAFITDEGGTLCHAAILAREMKKPCIIGTKIATQVLKDGDMVEVDANEGIIKKI